MIYRTTGIESSGRTEGQKGATEETQSLVHLCLRVTAKIDHVNPAEKSVQNALEEYLAFQDQDVTSTGLSKIKCSATHCEGYYHLKGRPPREKRNSRAAQIRIGHTILPL